MPAQDAQEGVVYKTASGEFIPDQGRRDVVGWDERGVARRLTGRVTEVHKPLISMGRCAEAGWLMNVCGSGGVVVHSKSKTGKKTQQAINKVLRQCRNHDAVPLRFRNKVLTFDTQFPVDGGSIQSADARAQDLAQVQANSVEPPPGLVPVQQPSSRGGAHASLVRGFCAYGHSP